jgi:hypothetical protein
MPALKVLVLLALQLAAPEAQLVERIRQHMAENLSHLPDYTCRQTITRAGRLGREGRFEPLDTFRLEVSFVGGRELFAWPGAARFEDRPIGELVGGGTIGTGSFALHARAIFLAGTASFSYSGPAVLEGRNALRLGYRVPRDRSRYIAQAAGHEAAVGYHGSFWVDPETLDLIRLEVSADDIPAEIGLRSIEETLDYARQSIGPAAFLLPRSPELILADAAGNQRRNLLRFDACRQFAGEAVVHFAETPGAAAPAGQAAAEAAPLPAGLALEAVLDGVIDTASAAIGDPVSATLAREVKRDGRVLAPRGAVLEGRITALKTGTAGRSGNYSAIGIRLETLRTEGGSRPINAILEDAGMPGVSRMVVLRGGTLFVSGRDSEHVGHLRMVWRTIAP